MFASIYGQNVTAGQMVVKLARLSDTVAVQIGEYRVARDVGGPQAGAECNDHGGPLRHGLLTRRAQVLDELLPRLDALHRAAIARHGGNRHCQENADDHCDRGGLD